MKELLGNTLIWQILLGVILLILPSPLLKKTGDKVGDAIEGVGGTKVRNTAYKILIDFAEGLKSTKYKGNIDLVSNWQVDKELDKYKVSLGLEESKSKGKD
ncbi:hypothetical protein [Psychrilyobacter sp.]|uniref:hypothetical protein n=1 Tax=Psychrilyobacter sp. TaxID=2586924 RepID=UPI0030168595